MKKLIFVLIQCLSLAAMPLTLLSEEKVENNGEKKAECAKEEKKDNEAEEKKDKDEEKKEKPEPPKVGNFALPTSQQPAALFGFGGNIIDKGEIQFFFFADDLIGKKKRTVDLIPGLLYGVTDDFSIFFEMPVTPLFRDGEHRSRGFEDWFVQLEWAFYNKSTYCYVDQATLVGNVTVPTGSIHKNPPTGFGAPSIFLGTTYYRTTVEWVLFTAYGAILPFSDHRTKFGNQFFYQYGIARNIPSPSDRIYAVMLEVDGQYNEKNRIEGEIDNNSGGNTIYVTPSIWFSTKRFLWQFGVSFPINQHLFGKQNKFDYVLNFNFGWSFYDDYDLT